MKKLLYGMVKTAVFAAVEDGVKQGMEELDQGNLTPKDRELVEIVASAILRKVRMPGL
jgi:hypothetical protein